MINISPSNILLAGSNPNALVNNVTQFWGTQFNVETLNPPFMFVARPAILSMPSKIAFNTRFTLAIEIPPSLRVSSIKGKLAVLAYSRC
jgi:hypothetical protein